MATKKRVLPKTWEQFCKLTNRDPKALPDTSMYDKRDKKNALANFKLPLMIRYCNEGKKLDYTNSDQWKYEPRFIVKADKKRPSGFGLSYGGYGYWRTFTSVGPRLCYADVNDLIHMTEHFIGLYEDLLL